MWNAILSPDFFGAILRAATPILFATLAAAIAAKSGITNMALEGIIWSYIFFIDAQCMAGTAYYSRNRRLDWSCSGIFRSEFKDG